MNFFSKEELQGFESDHFATSTSIFFWLLISYWASGGTWLTLLYWPAGVVAGALFHRFVSGPALTWLSVKWEQYQDQRFARKHGF